MGLHAMHACMLYALIKGPSICSNFFSTFFSTPAFGGRLVRNLTQFPAAGGSMHGAHLPPKAGIRCGADAVRAGVRAGVAGAGAAAGGRVRRALKKVEKKV